MEEPTLTPGPAGISVAVILAHLPGALAAIDWEPLVDKTRELSMSGVMGLLEADILFVNPGSCQPEHWRITQSILGIGSLRVLSKICQAPCLEFLHNLYGIKPPEAVEAREFWLHQESWTEISQLDMTQEDTSYHRVNQGSGPQARVLWTWDQIDEEHGWWNSGAATPAATPVIVSPPCPPDLSLPTPLVLESKELPIVTIATANSLRSGSDAAQTRSLSKRRQSQGLTPAIYASRKGADVAAGSTDKWWMDRWQCEVLAIAAIHGLTIREASNLATAAYFGRATSIQRDVLCMVACIVLTGATFATAWLTNWSWVPQFFALTALGYLVNGTASLRAWKFQPNPALDESHPELLHNWPDHDDGRSIVRIAVQLAGICHLRGLVALDRNQLAQARTFASSVKGRYKTTRLISRDSQRPYADSDDLKSQWLSYSSQSTFYGLAISVVPDNVTRRSLAVVFAIIDGMLLLILGFGATIQPQADGSGEASVHWGGIVLGIYLLGIITALLGRRRGVKWTMPEFEVVDLTTMQVPPSVRDRICSFKGAETLISASKLDV